MKPDKYILCSQGLLNSLSSVNVELGAGQHNWISDWKEEEETKSTPAPLLELWDISKGGFSGDLFLDLAKLEIKRILAELIST